MFLFTFKRYIYFFINFSPIFNVVLTNVKHIHFHQKSRILILTPLRDRISPLHLLRVKGLFFSMQRKIIMSIFGALLFLVVGWFWFQAQLNNGTTQANTPKAKLSCSGTSEVSYTPGLGSRLRSVSVSEQEEYGSCTSSERTGIASGSAEYQWKANLSCQQNFVGKEHRITYSWNTGEKSTVQFVEPIVTAPVKGKSVIQLNGTVVEGVFVGSKVSITIITAALDPATCSGLGIPERTGISTLTIQ